MEHKSNIPPERGKRKKVDILAKWGSEIDILEKEISDPTTIIMTTATIYYERALAGDEEAEAQLLDLYDQICSVCRKLGIDLDGGDISESH